MNNSLIIGGSNGIGLAIALELAKTSNSVTIVDKVSPNIGMPENVAFEQINLLKNDFSFLEKYDGVNTLIYTAGYGRVAPFETITETEIGNQFQVNAISLIKVLSHFYPRMQKNEEFVCAVMGSIAGLVSSPLFALYSATKAAVCKGIEAINIELEKSGTENRILNVSPGSIKGTRFEGGANDLSQTENLAQDILARAKRHDTLFIPDYEAVFKGVIDRYQSDPHQFGIDSYDYKMNAGRLNLKPQVKIGYLSGTFDLFHIGHLNLLRRAKQYCDYLVVGIHKDASHKGKETFIPFEERMAVVGATKYVDKVIPSLPEDCDIYKNGILHYDYLFVGSDYKGTERFNRYEEYFADKDVQIIYFPYTKGTSSTQIREAILRKNSKK
jgi:glycerol-3-phosphate cytidylyltransferase